MPSEALTLADAARAGTSPNATLSVATPIPAFALFSMTVPTSRISLSPGFPDEVGTAYDRPSQPSMQSPFLPISAGGGCNVRDKFVTPYSRTDGVRSREGQMLR